MTPESKRLRGRSRSGVTVIEVLFATGIVIFGLVGIASLLAVAGRNSTVANESAESQFYATSWQQEFLVRGWNRPDRWVWWGANGSAASAAVVPGARTAICIDPNFYSRADLSRAGIYLPGQFPYGNAIPNSNLARASLWDTKTTPSLQLLARQVFLSSDDLSMNINESDRTLAPSRFAVEDATGVVKFLSTGEYYWLATLSPKEDPSAAGEEDYYTLSVVIFHRRGVQFEPDPNSTTDVIASGEAWAQATWNSGFRYGAGGSVTIPASSDPDGIIKSGRWIMLSCNIAGTATVARWYRIISIAENGTNYALQLDGPDWELDAAGTAFRYPTQLTAVDGAVQVVERMIRVER